MADATIGLRDASVPTTAFRAAILLAATWDRNLANAYGASVDAEFRAADVDCLK